jgi:hypothetical protein
METAVTLQAKLDAFKADFEAGKPPYSVPRSVIETMHRATAELIVSGAADRAIGQDGTILYAEVNPDYTRRPEPEDMIPALERAASVTA